MKFTEGKLPVFGSAPDELRVGWMEFIEGDSSRPPTDTTTKKMDYYPEIIRYEVASCKNVIQPLYIQILITVVTKMSSFVQLEPKIPYEQSVVPAQPEESMKWFRIIRS